MLTTSMQLQNGSDPLRPLPFLNVIEALNVFYIIDVLRISRIPSRSYPETIPKERRRNGEGKAGKWKGKTDAIAGR